MSLDSLKNLIKTGVRSRENRGGSSLILEIIVALSLAFWLIIWA